MSPFRSIVFSLFAWFAVSHSRCSAIAPSVANEIDEMDEIDESPPPSPHISLQTLYHKWSSEQPEQVMWQLPMMLATATDGDEFYDLEEALPQQYWRAAWIIVRMSESFVTQNETQTLLADAFVCTYKYCTAKPPPLYRHPVEVLVDTVLKSLESRTDLFAAYQKLGECPALADLMSRPHNSTRYFDRVFDLEAGLLPRRPNYMHIPGYLRLLLQREFAQQLTADGAYSRKFYVLANAVFDVGRQPTYAERVEQIRQHEVDNLVSTLRRTKLVPFFYDLTPFTKLMMHRFEKAFAQDKQLEYELQKAKSAIELRIQSEHTVVGKFENRLRSYLRSAKSGAKSLEW